MRTPKRRNPRGGNPEGFKKQVKQAMETISNHIISSNKNFCCASNSESISAQIASLHERTIFSQDTWDFLAEADAQDLIDLSATLLQIHGAPVGEVLQ